jgi:hypothetical protein
MMPELIFSEVEPLGPWPAGIRRLERQIGEAFSRCFAAPFDGDGEARYWAYIEILCYQSKESGDQKAGPLLICETTYTICDATGDAPGDTEIWECDTYERAVKADLNDPDEAKRALSAVTLEDISWPTEFNQAVEIYAAP